MKNKTKALLIPIAAFAVTVTGASAFNSIVLENAGFDDTQITAFEQAHDLRKDGDKEGARDLLMDAGIDMESMHAMHDSMKEHRSEMHEAVQRALQDGNYEAFLEAVENSPMADKIASQDEFELFMEAHELREAGDKEEARAIMEELGFEGKMHKMNGDHKGHMKGKWSGYGGDNYGDHEVGGERRFNGFHGGHSE